MDPVHQPPHHPTKKPPQTTSSYATEEEEELEREIAMRDPDLAALMSRANSRRQQQQGPSFVHSFKQSQIGGAGGGEASSEEEEEETQEDGKTVVTFADTREYGDEEGQEEDPAETDEFQEETEDMVEPSEDARVPRQYARQNQDEYEEKLRAEFRADAERRRAGSPGSEPASDEDQTEGEEDEDEESDAVEEEEYPTDPLVIEEMEKFQTTFRGIEKRFRLINKIGEGTFSSVYKAEDLLYDRFDNSWDIEEEPTRRGGTRGPKYVAIKKIYVTSSPARIQNELELLHDLTGCKSVVPLITAFRYQDQVVAILPYFRHVDFREYFRTLTINDIVLYFKSLFSALSHVHRHGIIHRDIKPTNFLYDYTKGRGVLCDFGLAEREGTDSSYCSCVSHAHDKNPLRGLPQQDTLSQGYPKNDSRPARRANRAGTRGFRAPEVLFKCTSQTTKIDIWSAGVILLTILSKRFPFFNSSDDVDAIIEIATIFGKAKMRACAQLHGCIFETTIPTIGEKGFTLEKIILWATNRLQSGASSENLADQLPPGEALAVQFLQRCFELNPANRISADEALKHEFLNYWEDEVEQDEEDSLAI